MTGSATIQWLSLCGVALVCSGWLGWELVGRLSTQLDSMVRLGTGILIGLSALGILQTSVPLMRHFPLLTLPILSLFGVLLRLRTLIHGASSQWDIWRLKATAWGRFRDHSSTSLVIVGSAVLSVNYPAGFPRLLGAAIILPGLAFRYKDRLSHTARLIVSVFTITLLGLSELARRHEPGWWLSVSNDATFLSRLAGRLLRMDRRRTPDCRRRQFSAITTWHTRCPAQFPNSAERLRTTC